MMQVTTRSSNGINSKYKVITIFAQNIYLLHVQITTNDISIEVQDKYTGQLWSSAYSIAYIEDLTEKAKHPKKYAIFVKMLISALNTANQSLKLQILSYKELTSRTKSNGAQKQQNSEQQLKLYMILSYTGEYQKVSFPLPIKYETEVTPDRFKMTIHRLAQQLQVLSQQTSEHMLLKDLTLIKHENQLLKAKIKHLQTNKHAKSSTKQNQYAGNLNNSKNSQNQELNQQILDLTRQITERGNINQLLKLKMEELERNNDEKEKRITESIALIQQKDTIIKNLSNQEKVSKKQNQLIQNFETQLEILISEMEKLSSELQHAKEQDKKSKIKVQKLEEELESMISAQKNRREGTPRNTKRVIIEKQLSIRSGKSGKSEQKNTKNSKNVYGASNQIKNVQKKKSSIYDSDTESSKLRKLSNSRNSPFRQTSRPTNNNSGKKISRLQINPRENGRSRSGSKQKKVDKNQPSHLMTDGYDSSSCSDSEVKKANQIMKFLKGKNQPNTKKVEEKKKKTVDETSTVELKLNKLEEMIKNAKKINRKE